MKAFAPLVLLVLPCAAAPGHLAERLASEGFFLRASAKVPATHPIHGFQEGDTTRVNLAGLLDRHLTRADSFMDSTGRHLVGVTLDQTGGDQAWITITPPASTPRMVLIEFGMRASWRAGGRRYAIRMALTSWTSRLNNIIEIVDADADPEISTPLWRRRIIDLLGVSYGSGEPVVIAGRPYGLFLGRMPDESRKPAVPSSTLGLCLIYDQRVDGKHVEYFPYGALVSDLQRPEGVVLSLFEGDQARLRIAPDVSALEIYR